MRNGLSVAQTLKDTLGFITRGKCGKEKKEIGVDPYMRSGRRDMHEGSYSILTVIMPRACSARTIHDTDSHGRVSVE